MNIHEIRIQGLNSRQRRGAKNSGAAPKMVGQSGDRCGLGNETCPSANLVAAVLLPLFPQKSACEWCSLDAPHRASLSLDRVIASAFSSSATGLWLPPNG